MREIVFRGKSSREWKNVKSGQWVNGCLWHHTDKASIIYSDELDDKVWVFPNTVGQFTGLTDKNGKKIFEGDICRFDDEFMVIEWHDEDSMFYLLSLDGTNWTTNFSMVAGNELEVIGNIHDNPELLGEEMP